MQNVINDQEKIIAELQHFKMETVNELKDLQSQVGFKTDQLNEWKQKYEVNNHYYYFFLSA